MSKRLPKSYLKPLPRKEDVMRLLESCVSPGAKLAVGLAAFSGLRPGQVRELVFQNLVEFSIRGKQFSQMPSRVDLRKRIGWRNYYTFLSEGSCKLLLDDLSARGQPLAKERVLTRRALAEADRTLRAAKVRWFELRHCFHECFMVSATAHIPRTAVDFMLGYVVKEDHLIRVSLLFTSQNIRWLREQYAKVEKEFFV